MSFRLSTVGLACLSFLGVSVCPSFVSFIFAEDRLTDQSFSRLKEGGVEDQVAVKKLEFYLKMVEEEARRSRIWGGAFYWV